MRRRHSVVAVALGAALTTAVLGAGSLVQSPGIPGHQLVEGASGVLRLSDSTTTTVATVPAKVVAHHARAGKATKSAKAKAAPARKRTAQRAAATRAHVGHTTSPATGRRHKAVTAPTASTPAPAATAPVAAPAAAPAPPASAPAGTPVAATPRASLSLASASATAGGNVRVRLAVANATTKLPQQLDVNVALGDLPRPADAVGPMALDAALDLVPDPSDPSGVRLRMRMELADADSTPAAPAEDGVSNVVMVRLPVAGDAAPAPADPSPAEPTPADPPPTPAATPVEVQLPIATTDDSAGQTVQLPVPADDANQSSATAVPVDVSVAPVVDVAA